MLVFLREGKLHRQESCANVSFEDDPYVRLNGVAGCGAFLFTPLQGSCERQASHLL